MQTIKLYIKDWLAIHPYIQQQATDRYFVDLANRLYSTCTIRKIPESIKNLKSATKPLNVLIAFTRPLITEFADNLNLKHPLLPTISPYPTM